jgi:tripartite-type tricarboxylate transporter receptor subunit TctC
MNKEIALVVARPDVRAKLLEQGADGVTTSPEVLGRMVKREIAEWRTVVQRAGIEAN